MNATMHSTMCTVTVPPEGVIKQVWLHGEKIASEHIPLGHSNYYRWFHITGAWQNLSVSQEKIKKKRVRRKKHVSM